MKKFIKKTKNAILALMLGLQTLVAAPTTPVVHAEEENAFIISTDKDQPTGNNFEYIWHNRGELYQVLTFRSLFVADHTMTNFEPDLISDYEISEDGLTYTLTMKDGVKWSDGETLTAEDVKFSIEGALQAGKINSLYTSAFSLIEGADAFINGEAEEITGLTIDGDTVEFKLTQPFGNMVAILSQFAILPKHCLENEDMLTLHQSKFWDAPVTNGMYKVEEVNIDNYITLVPNEHYDKEMPKIEKVVVRQLDDEMTACLAGESSYTYTMKADDIKQLEETGNWTAHPVNSLYYRFLLFNAEGSETVNDPRVREAILCGVDREEIVKGLIGDNAVVNDSGVPASDETNYNPDNKTFAYDPERAKTLLDEAGFDYSKTIQFKTGDRDYDIAVAMAAYLQELGMNVEVSKFQGDLTTEYFEIRDYDITMAGLAAFDYSEWYSHYVTSANHEKIFGKNEAFVEPYNNYLAESDPKKKSEYLKELQTLEQEEVLKGFMYMQPYSVMIDTSKVDIADTQFGNPKYAYDTGFENWTLK